MNGGIISTVLDYHIAAVVLWESKQRGWEADDGAPIPFNTAGFDVRFPRPTLALRAVPVEISEAKVVGEAEVIVDDKARATMLATWLRFTRAS